MKRFIFVAFILQFALTPFCGVFAMDQKQAMIETDCASMQTTNTTHLEAPTPHLACCESRKLSSNDAQIISTFEYQAPAICLQPVSYNQIIHLIQRYDHQYSGLHPPDDFERLSQSKRE